MRLVAMAAVVAVTQAVNPAGCSSDPVRIDWTGPAARLGGDDVAGTFEIVLHGCTDWEVRTEDDHLEVERGWTSCAVSGVVRDGALAIESEAFRISGHRDQTIDFGLPSGPLGGMGAVIRARANGVEIRSVDEGLPAEMAGLRPGDRVVAVDGWSTRSVSDREFVRVSTGEPGTPVELEVRRDGEPMTVRFERVRILTR